jgi:hypothetical protein
LKMRKRVHKLFRFVSQKIKGLALVIPRPRLMRTVNRKRIERRVKIWKQKSARRKPRTGLRIRLADRVGW